MNAKKILETFQDKAQDMLEKIEGTNKPINDEAMDLAILELMGKVDGQKYLDAVDRIDARTDLTKREKINHIGHVVDPIFFGNGIKGMTSKSKLLALFVKHKKKLKKEKRKFIK